MNANIDDTGSKVRNLVADSTSRISSLGAEQYQATADSLKRQLTRLQDEFTNLQDAVSRNARNAAQQADTYVHENPWKTAGVAALVAGVAVCVAMLASRR